MERRLAAILTADVVGYSRLMEADEEATARTPTLTARSGDSARHPSAFLPGVNWASHLLMMMGLDSNPLPAET